MWIRTLDGLTFFANGVSQGTLSPTAEAALEAFMDELDREDAHRRNATSYQREESDVLEDTMR